LVGIVRRIFYSLQVQARVTAAPGRCTAGRVNGRHALERVEAPRCERRMLARQVSRRGAVRRALRVRVHRVARWGGWSSSASRGRGTPGESKQQPEMGFHASSSSMFGSGRTVDGLLSTCARTASLRACREPAVLKPCNAVHNKPFVNRYGRRR
jgi:hypothetical protein